VAHSSHGVICWPTFSTSALVVTSSKVALELLPERPVALCVSATRRLHDPVNDVVEVLQNRKAWQQGMVLLLKDHRPLLLHEQGLAISCFATTA
jgi:hypothetical protein